MKRLIRLDIPEGPERDTFIRRLAQAKTPEERQELVQKVEEFLEIGSVEAARKEGGE